jgi:hypothetical protein
MLEVRFSEASALRFVAEPAPNDTAVPSSDQTTGGGSADDVVEMDTASGNSGAVVASPADEVPAVVAEVPEK